MNYRWKYPALLAFATASALYVGQSIAQYNAPVPPQIETKLETTSGAPEREPPTAVMDALRAVMLRLDQAALESDFSSKAQGLARLRSARADLDSLISGLCCARQARAVRLESSIDRVIVRAGAQLEPLASTNGASLGPPAPNRNELVMLAKEGQALARDSASLPSNQRADGLLSASKENIQRQAPRSEKPPPTALSDPWSAFPIGQLDPKMYGFRF